MIKHKVLVIQGSEQSHEVTTLEDPKVIGPMDYGLKLIQEGEEEFLLFGGGLLAGSAIPGTHRLIVVGYSKLWEQFYDSTMGGAVYTLLRTGLDFIHLKGKCPETCYIKINRKKEEGKEAKLVVEFVPIDVEKVWEGHAGEKGFYALQQYIFDQHHEEFGACRVIATGPAAKQTRQGAMGSAPVEKGVVTPVDCWAGRGGMGSQMMQNHNIVGIIYGGDEMVRKPQLTNRAKIDEIFMEEFGKKMIPEDLAATKKYRYDDEFHSGGTLGVNFTKVKGELFCFNYHSVLWTEEKRIDIHKRFILDHYLKQFNEETIDTKQFKHCGEPCAAVCKKMRGVYKKDYEPYQTLGPNTGIFDQRGAELINHYVDMIGADAIQMGLLVDWIMDMLDSGVVPPEDFGLSSKPHWDIEHFDVVADSMHNANLAVEIVNMIVYDEKGAVFRDGIRNAAHKLAEKYGRKTQDLAAYNAQGEQGCMGPNQYWTPGMYSPMPLMGKYCTSYGVGYIPPREIGRKNVERMVFELYSDNGGLCRFHRKWIEKLLPKLVNTLYADDLKDVGEIDYHAHHRKLAQMINLNNKPVFWETEKVVDTMHGFLRRWSKILYNDPDVKKWLAKFDADKWQGAREFWQELLDGQNEAFK